VWGVPSGVASARVLVLAGDAGDLLGESGGERDGDGDGAGAGVGLLAGVDSSGAETLGRHTGEDF